MRQLVRPDVDKQADLVSLNTYPLEQELHTARVEDEVAESHVAQLEKAKVEQTVNYIKIS